MKKLEKLQSKLRHPVVKKNPVKALSLLLWLNIMNRLFPSGVVLTVFGRVKYLSRKGSSLNRNYWQQFADYEEFLFLKAVLKESDGLIDIGANVGEYALFAASQTGCKVYAFEPNYSVFGECIINIKLNNLNNVEAYNMGLAEKAGKLYLTNVYGTANRIVTEEQMASMSKASLVEVEIAVLDNFSFAGDRLFMKIDVEGYEFFVLNGAKKLLADPRLKAILIELNGFGKKFGVDDKDIHALLTDAGFIPSQFIVADNKIVELDTYRSDDFNTLYIRKAADLL